ncbi:dihydrodipicolinate synthetase family protein [Acephala macrosclerotiorum]|nr:dihydrodipicolinate synthetase family protein [Acephala macrosclerotiorum]
MNTHPNTPPPYGVYTPLVTFFNDDESLDLPSTTQHALRMATGKVAGLVIQGSNGEAPHLLHDERQILVRTIKETLVKNGHGNLKLIVGCGAASVKETLLYLFEAKEVGADYGLVLPPAYWTAAMSGPVVEKFFRDVATSTPLPFLIYNFPGVTGGIDISSDSIIRLAKENPAIVGVKLTCGNIGKLQRVASTLPKSSFAAMAGKSEFCLPAIVAGSNGVIAALANVVPKLHSELLRLYEAGNLKAAIELQSKLSHADWALQKMGVAGVKKSVAHHFGYGQGKSRRPLGSGPEVIAADIAEPINVVVALEKSL